MEVDSDGEQQLDSSADQDETSINLIAGKIVEIHLKNFLTHTEAIVRPSEQLNLVIFYCAYINKSYKQIWKCLHKCV